LAYIYSLIFEIAGAIQLFCVTGDLPERDKILNNLRSKILLYLKWIRYCFKKYWVENPKSVRLKT
jgi:hypothetical protein